MTEIAAVLWDMDGTLVDTEPYWMQAEAELMAAHSLDWNEDLGLLMVGNDLLDSAAILIDHGLPLAADEIVTHLLDRVGEQVAEHIPFRPGARELLARTTAAGIPNVLVTMSYRSLAEIVVAGCPDGSFVFLVTGEEVERGKPDPEPYLHAAARLGLDPGRCIALEDSVPGLTSAEAAGTMAIGIPHLVPLEPRPGRVLWETLDGKDLTDLAAVARTYRERCRA